MKTIKKEIIQENSSLNFLCDMKKVVCINEHWYGFGVPRKHPKYGEICTVAEEGVCGCGHCNSPIYVLEGFDDTQWQQQYFIPLSEIDETTFERNYEKEKV